MVVWTQASTIECSGGFLFQLEVGLVQEGVSFRVKRESFPRPPPSLSFKGRWNFLRGKWGHGMQHCSVRPASHRSRPPAKGSGSTPDLGRADSNVVVGPCVTKSFSRRESSVNCADEVSWYTLAIDYLSLPWSEQRRTIVQQCKWQTSRLFADI